MNIAIAGAGYVGLSLAVLLSQNNHVTIVDVVEEKTKMINDKKSPIEDKEIKEYLLNKNLDLWSTTDVHAYKNADYIMISPIFFAIPLNTCISSLLNAPFWHFTPVLTPLYKKPRKTAAS